MLDLLADPAAFFEEETEEPDLLAGVTVVALAGLLIALSEVLIAHRQIQTLPESMPGGEILFVVNIVGLVGLIAVTWLVFTSVFYGIATLIDDAADGTFRETLALTAWGNVPLFVSGGLTALTMYLAIQTIPAPANPNEFVEFSKSLRSNPVIKIGLYSRYPVAIWQGVLWTFAIEKGLGVERRTAVLSVAGPVAAAILWLLASQFVL